MSKHDGILSEKEQNEFNYNFLPKFVHQTKVKRGTKKEFLAIARLSSDDWESTMKNSKNAAKINWNDVQTWARKWIRKYPFYEDYRKAASQNRLTK